MKRLAFLGAILTALAMLLSGCHGSHAQNSTSMRALNAVPDAEPLDVLVDTDVKVSALATGSASSFIDFSSGTRDVLIRSSTTQASLLDRQLSFGSGVQNTLLIYGKRATMAVQVLIEDTIAPPSGEWRFRSVNLSSDSGSVDVYVTTTSLATSTPTIATDNYGVASDFAQGAAGTYTIYVTTAGTKDLLFQAASVPLSAGVSYTLAVVPAPGGKLDNGILLTSSGATTLANPNGRIKAVNAIPDAGTVNFKVDGATVLSSVPFTGTSSYVTVASGARALAIEASSAPGTNLASITQQIAAGLDYSVVAVGSLAAPNIAVFSDDNSLPAAGFVKVRFVNTGSVPVDALINFASQATNVAPGTASSYYTVPTALDYTITFTTAGGVTVLTTLTPVELDSLGVYSVYLFPGNTAKVVRDR
jgi:hypothetical protein